MSAEEHEVVTSTGGRYDLVRYAIKNDGEAYNRLELRADGSIYTGDGATPPTLFSGGGGGGGGSALTGAGIYVVPDAIAANDFHTVDLTTPLVTYDDYATVGTGSATGFTVPDSGFYSIQIMVIWSVPFPGPDPITGIAGVEVAAGNTGPGTTFMSGVDRRPTIPFWGINHPLHIEGNLTAGDTVQLVLRQLSSITTAPSSIVVYFQVTKLA